MGRKTLHFGSQKKRLRGVQDNELKFVRHLRGALEKLEGHPGVGEPAGLPVYAISVLAQQDAPARLAQLDVALAEQHGLKARDV